MASIGLLNNSLFSRPRRPLEPRMFAGREVIIQWESGARVGVAKVVEWSSIGLRIEHNLPLDKNCAITIVTPDCDFDARIAWLFDDSGVREAGLLLQPQAHLRTLQKIH